MVCGLFNHCKRNTAKQNAVAPYQKVYKKLTLIEEPKNIDLPGHDENLISTRDDALELKKYPKNIMRFQRYNVITFLPVFLFLFFMKITNMYFQIMTAFFMVPAISPYTNAGGIFPIAFITIVAMVREIIEDFGRYLSDKKANTSKFLTINNGQIYEKYWKDLVVGDLVIVKRDESIPADIQLLSSSNPDGCSYMQTSNLDGEKTQKPRLSVYEAFCSIGVIPKSLMPNFKNEEKISDKQTSFPINQKMNVYVEEPSISLYHFEGYAKFIENGEEVKNPIPIDGKNFQFKGSKLKNTDYILGLALYVGKHTKIQLNSGESRIKDSTLRKKLDMVILFLFAVQVLLSIFGFFGNYIVQSASGGDYQAWLEEQGLDETAESVLQFLRYIVILQFIIPISIVVAMELVKGYQIILMYFNDSLKGGEGNRNCRVNTVTINEELGQIEYILSDKTGTLTVNKMEFKTCNILGNTFGGSFHAIGKQVEFKDNLKTKKIKFENCTLNDFDPTLSEIFTKSCNSNVNTMSERKVTNENFGSPQSHETKTLLNENKNSSNKIINASIDLGGKTYSYFEVIRLFMNSLAMCNECLIERDDDKSEIYQYTSSSPDEIALANAANRFGFKLIKRNGEIAIIDENGENKDYTVSMVFEFDSERKRQSVILKYEDQYMLFTKGADSSILPNLDTKINQSYTGDTNKFLYNASVKGLRTLCFAVKLLSDDEYKNILASYHDIQSKPDRDQNLQILASKIENNLVLIGATAIEDKLQDEVAETITDFSNAGIKVWMITGDKLETAENIALSCGITNLEMSLLYLQDVNKDDFNAKIEEIKNKLNDMGKDQVKGIIVEMSTLDFIFKNNDDDPKTKQMYDELCSILLKMNSVVCCRSTPKQKAKQVRMVKSIGKVCLSVGDGANDVNMITEADIGVGIYGQEGLNAVNASDYGIGEFKCLKPLILVQGRWFNFRNSNFIKNFLFKNVLIVVPLFVYAWYSNFGGLMLYEQWYAGWYNTLFSTGPVMLLAFYDYDISYLYPRPLFDKKEKREILERPYVKKYYHKLYYTTREGYYFNYSLLLLEFFVTMIEGFFISFVSIYATEMMTLDDTGRNADLWTCCMAIFNSIIFGVNLVILMRSNQLTWLMVILGILLTSLGPYFMFVGLYDNAESLRSTNVSFNSWTYTYDKLIVQLVIFVNVSFICIAELLWQTLKLEFYPLVPDYFKALVRNGMDNNESHFIDVNKKDWIKAKVFDRNHSYAANIKKSIHEWVFDESNLESDRGNKLMVINNPSSRKEYPCDRLESVKEQIDDNKKLEILLSSNNI